MSRLSDHFSKAAQEGDGIKENGRGLMGLCSSYHPMQAGDSTGLYLKNAGRKV
jgi:hypothetical protein